MRADGIGGIHRGFLLLSSNCKTCEAFLPSAEEPREKLTILRKLQRSRSKSWHQKFKAGLPTSAAVLRGPQNLPALFKRDSRHTNLTSPSYTLSSLLLSFVQPVNMTGKRPHEPDGSAESNAKRRRSDMGGTSQVSGESEVDRKKREMAEKMAAVKARLAGSKAANGTAPPTPDTAQQSSIAGGQAAQQNGNVGGGSAGSGAAMTDAEKSKADVQRKIAEMKAKMAAKRGDSQALSTNEPPQPSEKEQRIAEARARAAQLKEKVSGGTGRTTPAVPPPPPPRQDGPSARGGLGVGLHPSLMGDSGASAAGSKVKGLPGPKFSTTKGNQQPAKPKVNPYLSGASDEDGTSTPRNQREDTTSYDPNFAAGARERKSKGLSFNPRGKYINQANAIRQQAKLDEMKRRIAAETRKVEIEEASDRAFLVPKPPEVEWWDEGLLPEGKNSYENCLEEGRNKINQEEDGIITLLIQRPALLKPPQDKFTPDAKPLMLTQKEQKKLRRQRRMADMKEEQAKIRLGLVEAPAPKVKKSNMMRVLGEQAVKDPTAVEARVNREIAQRAADHEKSNQDRALTKEQRHEKLKNQQAGDEAKGVKIAVFRIDNLSSGKHRFKLDMNAKQQALTGVVVLHPTMNLLIAEGGHKSVGDYKKLLLNRIKWDENTMPLDASNQSGTFTHQSNRDDKKDDDAHKGAYWINPMDEDGNLKDLSENRCVLVWEGDVGARVFRKWGSKAVETDGEAKDFLGRTKMENMWTLARSK